MASSDPNQPPGGDNLDQSEIDRLMAEAATSAGGGPPVFRHTGESFSGGHPARVEAHDFANPMAVDEVVLRALRQRHDEFAALLSARLSIFLRMDFTLKVQRLALISYKRFAASVANPSHNLLFKVDPLVGVGVLDASHRLGMTIVDRMLGGNGRPGKVGETFTEIEMNVLDDTLQVVLEEWCRLWGSDHKYTASIVGRESGGRYLQSSASDTVMLVVVLEGSLGDCTERMQLAIPLPSIEGILRGIAASLITAAGSDASQKRKTSWHHTYSAIPIRLDAGWHAREISLREVMDLTVGTVLRLPREIIQQTRLSVGDTIKFIGEIGVEDTRLAVRIDQKISSEDI